MTFVESEASQVTIDNALEREAGEPISSVSHSRLILKNFVALSSSSLFEHLINFFTGIYARQVLGVIAIGQVGWTAAIVSYLTLLVNPGLQVVAKREVARDSNQAGQFVILLAIIQVALATLAFGLAVLFSIVVPRSAEVRLLLLLQGAGLFLLPLDITWLLQARERLAVLAGASMGASLLQAALLVLVIHQPSDVVQYVVLAYPCRLLLYSFILYYGWKQHLFVWQHLQSVLSHAWKLMGAGFPIGLSQLAVLIYYNSDSIFLGFTYGAATVGLYSTAYYLMLAPTFLSSALLNAYFPLLSRVTNDDEAAKQVSGSFLKAMIWLSFPIAALGWAVGRYVILLLFGREYAGAGPIFEWLCLNLALIFFNTAYGWPLNAWGAQRRSFLITLVGAIVNLALNFLLIPRFGLWGAVTTTLLAELAVMTVTIWMRRNLHALALQRPVLTTLLVCIPAALVSRWLSMQINWYFAALSGLVICATGLFLFEREDVMKICKNITVRMQAR